MFAILTQAFPILLGFVAKLIAIKSQAQSDNQKMMIEALAAKNAVIQDAREASNKESPMAAINRRVLIFVILGLVALYPLSGAFLNVDTVMPIITEGFNFLGFQITPDETEFITVKGLLVFPEIFAFLELILYFYFGSQLAKGR